MAHPAGLIRKAGIRRAEHLPWSTCPEQDYCFVKTVVSSYEVSSSISIMVRVLPSALRVIVVPGFALISSYFCTSVIVIIQGEVEEYVTVAFGLKSAAGSSYSGLEESWIDAHSCASVILGSSILAKGSINCTIKVISNFAVTDTFPLDSIRSVISEVASNSLLASVVHVPTYSAGGGFAVVNGIAAGGLFACGQGKDKG